MRSNWIFFYFCCVFNGFCVLEKGILFLIDFYKAWPRNSTSVLILKAAQELLFIGTSCFVTKAVVCQHNMRFCWHQNLKIRVVCRTKANQSFCSINNEYQSPRCWGKGKSKLSAGKATLGTLFACFWNGFFFFSLLSLRKECPPWILYQSAAALLLSLSTYCDSGFCLTFTKICCTRTVLCRLCWVASLSYFNLVCFGGWVFFPLWCFVTLCVLLCLKTSPGVREFCLVCNAVQLLCAINWIQVLGINIFLLQSHKKSLAKLCPCFMLK